MTRAVLLAGGWAHPGDDLIATFSALAVARRFELSVVTDPGSAAAELRAGCDLLVVGSCWFSMTDERYSSEQRSEYAVELDADLVEALTALRREGCPLLALHTAVICFDGHPIWSDWLGGTWNWETSWHPAPTSIDVVPASGVSLDVAGFSVVDELYQGLDVADSVEVIARSSHGEPLVWLTTTATNRVAVDLLGHDRRSLDDPGHLALTNTLLDWLLDREPAATAAQQ